LALLFEKYSNFQKVIQAQSTQELGDLFVELILDLSDYRSIKSSNRQMLIQNVISYISENYQENISLNDAAKKVFLSPSYLSTLVTSETGKSFTDILNETRIQKAIQLLKDPTRKIAEIAYEVGFREPQYFTIAFKKYTELTPRDYRELYLKG
jgi:response regulator receiver protein